MIYIQIWICNIGIYTYLPPFFIMSGSQFFTGKSKQKSEQVNNKTNSNKINPWTKINQLKQPHIWQIENCQNTILKPFTRNKMKIGMDEQNTNKIVWNKEISSPNMKNKQKQKKSLQVQPSLQISQNKKVEQILNKAPLRQKFSHLLTLQMQLPISFDHQQIIKRMELIDRTIEFLSTHRNVKLFYFQSIKKSIFQTSSILIEMKLIQQLLFLDPSCYNIEWAINEKTNRYDLKLSLPKNKTLESRKMYMRKKIVQYLQQIQIQFLSQKNIIKNAGNKWHEQFEYKNVSIPESVLPQQPEPQQRIKNSNLPIRANANPNSLQNFLVTKKKEQKIKAISNKSVSCSSVANMIFSRKPGSEISMKILEQIKQKQKRIKQTRQNEQIGEIKIDTQTMLKIFDEIYLIYADKRVSNIFKITLIEILQNRLKIKDSVIMDEVQKLLKMQHLNYFRLIHSSKNVEVVQIDKLRYAETRTILQGMKK